MDSLPAWWIFFFCHPDFRKQTFFFAWSDNNLLFVGFIYDYWLETHELFQFSLVETISSYHIFAGWGKTSHPGLPVNKLQQACVPIVDNLSCHRLNYYWYKVPVTSRMMCAGSGPSDRTTGCHGDSGGPLSCRRSDGTWFVQGVVSWGSSKCDTKLAYTVFARVTQFHDWIVKTMLMN